MISYNPLGCFNVTSTLPFARIYSKKTANIQKERGILPVTRPTSRGSGIAQSVRTSNAEAHAVCIYTTTIVVSR